MNSEVADIRDLIVREYLAARWGLVGLAYGTARHAFITARIEQVGARYQHLQELVGDQATPLIAETLDHLPEHPTRYYLQRVLEHELDHTEETAHLIDYVLEAWETLDLLTERFGRENALKILTTPACLTEVVPS